MESSPLRIGVVADPEHWTHWEQAKAFLEPARARGDFASVIEPDEELFAVLDGDELLAVATAWFDVGERRVEIKLVGGREHRRWIAELDGVIGATARRAGARSMVAIGRAGWRKALPALGWAVIGETGGSLIYAREI
jgi:hypothetical protein